MSSVKKLEAAKNSVRRLINESYLSFTTQIDYKRILCHSMGILHDAGYQLAHIQNFKQKHAQVLVEYYKASGLSTRSIKNKLSALRFACKHLGKAHVFFDNKTYELPKIKPKEIQKAIHEINLAEFDDPNIRFSVALQKEFGLRREESLKFDVSKADKGDYILLQASWTKGGIERDVSITNDSQRALLNEIKIFHPRGSLIPKQDSYVTHRARYDEAVRQSSYTNLHGLRHAYAQRRYHVLTGMNCPRQGGKLYKDMTDKEKSLDRDARAIISEELGHSRISITKIYCG